MHTSEIQDRIDTMPARMSVKGLRDPKADFNLKGNGSPVGMLAWAKSDEKYRDNYEWFRADGETEILCLMDAYINALPSIEEAQIAEFTTHLAETIELGRRNGIDVTFVNPLVEAMKRLSENAITFKRAA